jgi:hypothetical protein
MNATVNQKPVKSQSEVLYAVQKPYISISKTTDKYEIEVIDGFATGLINLVKKAMFTVANQLIIILERVQSPTFNCYFNEVTEIPEQVKVVKIIIQSGSTKITESEVYI